MLIQRKCDAFTLAEALIAVAVLGIFAGGALYGLVRLNEYAMVSRLSTAAQSLAQEQLDQMQSQRPFNPQRVPPEIPDLLQLTGTAGTTETNLPLFVDPEQNTVVVRANRTRTVTQVSSGNRLYRLQSSVSYKFRGRTMPTITLTCLRGSDE